jgi:hypothetical protein
MFEHVIPPAVIDHPLVFNGFPRYMAFEFVSKPTPLIKLQFIFSSEEPPLFDKLVQLIAPVVNGPVSVDNVLQTIEST